MLYPRGGVHYVVLSWIVLWWYTLYSYHNHDISSVIVLSDDSLHDWVLSDSSLHDGVPSDDSLHDWVLSDDISSLTVLSGSCHKLSFLYTSSLHYVSSLHVSSCVTSSYRRCWSWRLNCCSKLHIGITYLRIVDCNNGHIHQHSPPNLVPRDSTVEPVY